MHYSVYLPGYSNSCRTATRNARRHFQYCFCLLQQHAAPQFDIQTSMKLSTRRGVGRQEELVTKVHVTLACNAPDAAARVGSDERQASQIAHQAKLRSTSFFSLSSISRCSRCSRTMVDLATCLHSFCHWNSIDQMGILWHVPHQTLVGTNTSGAITIARKPKPKMCGFLRKDSCELTLQVCSLREASPSKMPFLARVHEFHRVRCYGRFPIRNVAVEDCSAVEVGTLSRILWTDNRSGRAVIVSDSRAKRPLLSRTQNRGKSGRFQKHSPCTGGFLLPRPSLIFT